MYLDKLEKISKIASVVAVPVVVAVVGWYIQDSLAKRNVSQEYVKLAVSILKEEKDKVGSALRDWAVDLLNENSPTRFSKTVAENLKAGQINLPAQIAAIMSAGGGGASLAISPDGKTVTTGHTDGTAKIWDLLTGQAISVFVGHVAPVTAVAYSPDARYLLTGSLDSTARLWNLSTGQQAMVLEGHTNGIIGVSFSPDGQVIFSRSLDRTLRKWDVRTGKLLSSIQVPD